METTFCETPTNAAPVPLRGAFAQIPNISEKTSYIYESEVFFINFCGTPKRQNIKNTATASDCRC